MNSLTRTLALTLSCGLQLANAAPKEASQVTIPPCCDKTSRAAVLASRFNLLDDQKSWSFTDQKAWKWSKAGGVTVLKLEKPSEYQPTYRSPFNIAWWDAKEWKDFTLTAEVKLTKFDQGNNDLCLLFGGESATRFYYAHMGEKADNVHHQFHLVDNADRKAITGTRTEGTPWKEGTWHRVRLVRNFETGDIAIWWDDLPDPILTAKDKTIEWGRIGLGSFDDLGEFRNVTINGISRPRAQKP